MHLEHAAVSAKRCSRLSKRGKYMKQCNSCCEAAAKNNRERKIHLRVRIRGSTWTNSSRCPFELQTYAASGKWDSERCSNRLLSSYYLIDKIVWIYWLRRQKTCHLPVAASTASSCMSNGKGDFVFSCIANAEHTTERSQHKLLRSGGIGPIGLYERLDIHSK